MKKLVARFMLWLVGWKIQKDIPEIPKKCVAIGAPHVGYEDGFAALFGAVVLDMRYRVMVKKSLMKPPLGWMIGLFGAFGIDRYSEDAKEQRRMMIQKIKEEMNKSEKFIIVLAPEGTRKKVTRWKMGFYNIAIGTGVPIILCYMDHVNKIGGVGKIVYPTGDVEKDMHEIMAFYNTIPQKYPDQFALDERYWKEDSNTSSNTKANSTNNK